MTKCIDVSENRDLQAVSPVAMGVFVVIFFFINLLIKFGILYIICVIIAYALTQMFFQYTPRVVMATLKYITRSSHLSPSFDDIEYDSYLERYPEIVKVLKKNGA